MMRPIKLIEKRFALIDGKCAPEWSLVVSLVIEHAHPAAGHRLQVIILKPLHIYHKARDGECHSDRREIAKKLIGVAVGHLQEFKLQFSVGQQVWIPMCDGDDNAAMRDVANDVGHGAGSTIWISCETNEACDYLPRTSPMTALAVSFDRMESKNRHQLIELLSGGREDGHDKLSDQTTIHG